VLDSQALSIFLQNQDCVSYKLELILGIYTNGKSIINFNF
jgi:hypothetical protein